MYIFVLQTIEEEKRLLALKFYEQGDLHNQTKEEEILHMYLHNTKSISAHQDVQYVRTWINLCCK